MDKKILFVSIGALTSGGAERVLSVLSKPFADSFDRVDYIIWRSLPVFYEIDKRVKIVDLEALSGSRNTIKKMWWFRKYVQNNHPNLVLSFLYPWSMRVIPSLFFTRTRVVVAERLDGRIVVGGKTVRLIRDLLYLNAHGILVQTEENIGYYLKPLRKKIVTIYNPVIMDEIYLGSGLNTLKNDLIVSVGRLHEQKNHEMLIDAFAGFYKSHHNYRLVIYGEGENKENLMKRAEDLGISESVSLPGAIKDVFPKIGQARIFVLSSNYEGMPNVLIEAMCVGLPCITTKVSGTKELIKNGENGILVNIGDAKGLERAIEKVADNKMLADKLAHNAVKIYQIVNRDKIQLDWINYINGIIDSPNA